MPRQTPIRNLLPPGADAEVVSTAASRARITVVDDATCAVASNNVRVLRQFEKEIKAHHKPALDAAKAALDEVKALQTRWLDPVLEALRHNEAQVRGYEARKWEAEQAAAKALPAHVPTVAEMMDPLELPMPAAPARATKVAGVPTYTRTDLEVLNVREVLEAVLAGTLPIDVIDVSTAALRRVWQATGQVPPGCGTFDAPVTQIR